MVVSDPVRLVAIVTRDAVEELGLKPGHGDDRDRQVDQRDHPALAKGASVRVAPLRHCRRRVVAARLGGRAGQAVRAPSAQITVYAAASLTDVFPQIDSAPKYSFGGSNTLAAQIQQGAPADVFASANMTLPAAALREGPRARSRSSSRGTRSSIVVPKSNPAEIRSVYDLTQVRDQARDRRPGRAGRQLHAADPART